MRLETGTMRFEGGALRLTRTPGRQSNPNTVDFGEIFEREYLDRGFVSFSFTEEDAFFRLLPLGNDCHGRRDAAVCFVSLYRSRLDWRADYDFAKIYTLATFHSTPVIKKDHQRESPRDHIFLEGNVSQ